MVYKTCTICDLPQVCIVCGDVRVIVSAWLHACAPNARACHCPCSHQKERIHDWNWFCICPTYMYVSVIVVCLVVRSSNTVRWYTVFIVVMSLLGETGGNCNNFHINADYVEHVFY